MGQGDPSFQKQGFTRADPTTLAREEELYNLGLKNLQQSGNTSTYLANRFGPSYSTPNVTPNLSSYGPTYNPGSNVESGEFSDQTGNRNEFMNVGNRPFYGHGYEDVSGGYSPGGGTEQTDPNLGLTGGAGPVTPTAVRTLEDIQNLDAEAAKDARHKMQDQRFRENLAVIGSESGDEFGGRSQVREAQALGEHQRAQNLIDVEEDQRLAENRMRAALGQAEVDQTYGGLYEAEKLARLKELANLYGMRGTVGMEDYTKKVGPLQQAFGGTLAGVGLLGQLGGIPFIDRLLGGPTGEPTD